MAKPDRTSARTLKLPPQNHESVLTEKQLKLAKFAYDRGYYDIPKRIKITELAEQLGLVRSGFAMSRRTPDNKRNLMEEPCRMYVKPSSLSFEPATA